MLGMLLATSCQGRPSSAPSSGATREPRLYANHPTFADRIVRYDPATYEPIESFWVDRFVPGFRSLLDFLPLPDGRVLAVVEVAGDFTEGASEDRLYLMDPARRKSLYLHEVPDAPSRLFATRFGQVIVTHAIRFENSRYYLSVLSTDTGLPICHMPVEGLPQDIAPVAPDLAYVLGVVDSEEGGSHGLVHRIDPSRCTVEEAWLRVGLAAQGLAASPAELYVSYAAPRQVPVPDRNSVVVYAAASRERVGQISVPDQPYNMHVAGGSLYVNHFDPSQRGGSQLTVIDLGTRQLTKVLEVSHTSPFGFCSLPSRGKLLLGRYGADGFYELPLGRIPDAATISGFLPRLRYEDPPRMLRCLDGAGERS